GNPGLWGATPSGLRESLASLLRVAADGNPGKQDATPSGLRESLASLPRVAADGNPGKQDATPSGLRESLASLPRVAADGNAGLWGATPSGIAKIFGVFTQGSRGRQPWAMGRNPFRDCENLWRLYPRVAADGNPGLWGATPSGIAKIFGVFTQG